MEELILKDREVKQRLVEVINDSNLPAFILKPIIKEIYEQLNNLTEQQYQEALKSKQNKLENKEE